ncbi:hypothetical protein [Actinomarinicola tropica]|nr:hypothetical protein [Actinomarinicola tropica]
MAARASRVERHTRGRHLRLAPPRNNQTKGIRWAADDEIRPLQQG